MKYILYVCRFLCLVETAYVQDIFNYGHTLVIPVIIKHSVLDVHSRSYQIIYY